MQKKLIQKLNENQDKIISKLKSRIRNIELYFYIKENFDNDCNICHNNKFQNIYRKFYVMYSAGLTEKHFEIYFQLLERKIDDLEKILSDLFEIKRRKGDNSVQFSFATKLLHTINNDLPIYDKHIGEVAKLSQPNDNSLSKEQRIAKRVEIYNKLINFYNDILQQKEIQKLIRVIRQEFNWSKEKISDLKVLDYILWAYNQLNYEKEKI